MKNMPLAYLNDFNIQNLNTVGPRLPYVIGTYMKKKRVKFDREY